MPLPSALTCVRCSARHPASHHDQDCPACRAKGAGLFGPDSDGLPDG